MARRFACYPIAILILLSGVSLLSCSDEGPDDDSWKDPDCIGSAGGTVAETDTSDLLYGVSLEVEPGAWQDCWSVYLWYHSTFSTPNFPDGIEGYEGWLTGGVEVEIGRATSPTDWLEAPRDMPMKLTFPLRTLTTAPGERLAAFRWDKEAGIYRLAFPERVDDRSMTISTTRRDSLWTWGKVDLGEIDFDAYLAPVMEQMHGEGAWLQIQAELDSLQAAVLANRRQLTCTAVTIVRGSLAAARDQAAENVRSFQDAFAGRCGTCDATTRAFYDGLSEYLKLNVEKWLTDFFLGDSKNFLIAIYGCIMSGYLQWCIDELACDYECFVDVMPAAFYYVLAIYYVSVVTVDLIDWALESGYIDCP